MKNFKRLFICACVCIAMVSVSYMGTNAEEQTNIVLLPHIHAGDEASGGVCYEPVYHVHTGNSSVSGGCYTVKKTSSSKCTQGYRSKLDYVCKNCLEGSCQCGAKNYAFYYEVRCPSHGQIRTGWTNNTTTINGSCDRTNTSTYYTLGCGKDSSTVERYRVNCNQTNCGSISIISSDSDPVQSLILSYEVTSVGGGCAITDCEWLHDGTIYSSDENMEVNENGDYTCQVTYLDKVSNQSGIASVSINITNIDREPPIVESCTITPEELTNQSVDITVTATDSSEMSYRIDENEWQSTPVFTVEENGTYRISVKDRAGNQTTETVEVTNIDKDGPQISLQMEKEPWYTGNNKILVAAYDENGLADEPYSYDLGNTWTDIAELEITLPGDYSIMVRDVLGNTSDEIIHTEKTALPPTPTPEPTNIPKTSTVPIPTITIQPTSTSTPTPTEEIVLITEPPTIQNRVPAVTVSPTHIPTLTPEPTPTSTPTPTPAPTNTPVPTAIPSQNPEEDENEDKEETVYIEESKTPTSGFLAVIRYVANPLAAPVEGGIFLIFGFYLFGTAKLYARSLNGQYIALGRVGKIRKHKEKCYVMHLKKRFLKRAETGQYMLRFSKRFVKKHESELLIIKTDHGESIQTRVAKEVTFSIGEE